MKVRMPQEIEVWYLIPAIRRELAKAMLKEGRAQKAIAKTLGVTEAAVSHYMKSKRAAEVTFSSDVSIEIKEAAKRVSAGSPVVAEMQNICKLCRADQTLCKLHAKYGAPSGKCSVCMP
jgi:predicted transcriptional regulator